MQDLFAPLEIKDVRRNLTHWKGIADTMARKYPKYMYAIVEDMHGSYVCVPITPKSDRDIVYQTERISH